MTLYKQTIQLLKNEDLVSELYRFQGARSYECFKLSKDKFLDNPDREYVYFSKSFDHHRYFIVKRTKQLLNEVVLRGTDYQINTTDLAGAQSYNRIKHIIINSDKLPNLSSIRLVCDKNYPILLKDNAVKQQKKQTKDIIERVDRRAYGGGYGVDKEWKDLLSYLTYFVTIQKIERKDVLQLLSNMRRTGRTNRKDNVTFLENHTRQQTLLNPLVESDFTKYKIMEALETILDRELCLERSELYQHPTKTIKQITSTYESNRQKILTIFDKHEKM